MKTKIFCIAGLAGLMLAAGSASAESRLLGSIRLAHHEKDVDIVSTSCRPRVNAIKLEVRGGHVEIENLWVRYGNGKTDRLPVRQRIAKGGETRWIDLSGRKRCVVAVGVVGDTEHSHRKARINIIGRW